MWQDAPVRLTALGALLLVLVLLGGDRPADAHWRDGPRGVVVGPVGAALDGYLRRIEAFGFSGSVLVARRGEVVLDRGYGLADEETGESYTAATLFDVASVSKQFTAAAVLKLEMEGRLRVADTVGRFFPDAPADKAGITLHQLLTHTSGLPDVLGAEYERIGRREMLQRLFAAPLLGPPGRRFRYSNAGYCLLAAVVEAASGRPLGDFMRQRLFLPAGMRHTGFRLPYWDRRGLAHGYSLDGPSGTPLDHPWADDGPYWNLRGNGGVLSTTGDLYLWHAALTGDGVLSRGEREKILTPYVSEGRHTPSRYGYGWSINSAPDGSRMASHTGGNGVFETDFRRYLDNQEVLIASSNHADYSAVSVAGHLEDRLFAQPDPEPPSPAALAPDELRRCAGRYLLAGGETLAAAAGGGGLRLTASGPAGLDLLLAGQSAEERALMKDREDRVREALAGARRGDFTALADLIGLPVERVRRPFRATMNLFEHQLGAWSGDTVLGSASLGGYPYTYARLVFAGGSRLVRYRWTGPTVETVRYPDAALATLFLPEQGGGAGGGVLPRGTAPAGGGPPAPAVAPAAAGGGDAPAVNLRFGTYDVRTGAVAHLRCNLPPPAAGGVAASLVFTTPAGEVAVLRGGGG
jgi:CubicO group peptidase (beta-lactamase class C family)